MPPLLQYETTTTLCCWPPDYHHHHQRRRRRRPWLLQFFGFLEMVVIIASLRLAGSQILPLLLFLESSSSSFSVLDVILRLYITFFCLTIILIELELPIRFLKQSVLQLYVTRGVLYSFVGLAARTQAVSVEMQDMVSQQQRQENMYYDYVPWLGIFIFMSSIPLIVLGLLYVILGVLCLQGVRDRLQREHEERLEEYRQQLESEQRGLIVTSVHADNNSTAGRRRQDDETNEDGVVDGVGDSA